MLTVRSNSVLCDNTKWQKQSNRSQTAGTSTKSNLEGNEPQKLENDPQLGLEEPGQEDHNMDPQRNTENSDTLQAPIMARRDANETNRAVHPLSDKPTGEENPHRAKHIKREIALLRRAREARSWDPIYKTSSADDDSDRLYDCHPSGRQCAQQYREPNEILEASRDTIMAPRNEDEGSDEYRLVSTESVTVLQWALLSMVKSIHFFIRFPHHSLLERSVRMNRGGQVSDGGIAVLK
ncbi:hypothetical protein SERLA73DRAFT_149497 [Serpula lacrymans var. lacrymans S7.3]|uniref:Uncharacterized protein n=1 Tax=Serpula lacrymans var. lacrymans (strain S7.3) TaxID=936435 RepID=F8PG00_SERL3|nr:hypothetical protein SERLA73DRAFT_149497 [Serpula lacrymans var. lacrymans S7.3]